MVTENELLKEFTELVNQITRLLLPYKEHPVVNSVEKSITCEVEWKSDGHQCSRGINIYEEDGKLVASRNNAKANEETMQPQEAIKLAQYATNYLQTRNSS